MADQGGVVDEAQKSSLAEDFCAITASTTETALFFLESHNWNLDSAIHSFFEADEDDHHDALAEEAPSLPPPAAIPRPNMPPPSAAPRPNIPPPSAAPVPNARMSKKASSGGGGGGRPIIRTLADLNRQSGAGSDSDDSDGPAEHYTGGDKSGKLVQDPSKGDVDAIFEQARQMGALDGPSEHRPSSSSRSFTGTGRLLSDGTVVPASPQRPEDVIHDIIFWTNGFTVNDGLLRRFEDPENAPFLESIGKSECPKELEPADRRSEVNVNLIRKTEKFPEPPKRSTAFQGVGRTLGEGSASGSVVVQPTIAAAAAAAASVAAPDLSIGLSVDASLPATSLQLRLADGTRMVARFNMSHTVGHIRAFIDASRPFALRTYQLQTVGFPPKQLADSTQTIEQAGLANSVIVQKL